MKANFKFTNTKGVEYEIVFRKPRKDAYGEGTVGLCIDPNEDTPKIYISPHQTKNLSLTLPFMKLLMPFFGINQKQT